MNPGAAPIPQNGADVNRYIYSMTIVVHMYYPREVPQKLGSVNGHLTNCHTVTKGTHGGSVTAAT